MEGAKNNTNTSGYTEKTLVLEILRELINWGYVKNGKNIINKRFRKFKK